MTRADDTNRLIDSHRAYLAIPRYIEGAYGPPASWSEDLGLLATYPGNDPGCEQEWDECVRSEFRKLGDARSTPRFFFDVMRCWIEQHAALTPHEDFLRVARDAHYDTVDETGAPSTPMWPIWLRALEAAE